MSAPQFMQDMLKGNTKCLRANPYPGRLIVQGLCPDPRYAFQFYAIMGRSDNSRNRIFVADKEAHGDLHTDAFDPSKVKDPSLIIYQAMAESDGIYVVSNGIQTPVVLEAIRANYDIEGELHQRGITYEPDAPNHTPRITGAIVAGSRTAYFLTQRRGNDGEEARDFFETILTEPGTGYCFHTYLGNSEEDDPLPSFNISPYPLWIEHADPTANLHAMFNLLIGKNLVSMASKIIDLEGKTPSQLVIRNLNCHASAH
ncbi:MAG: IMP cyclohydrolase [Patescibacteria group bacterium]